MSKNCISDAGSTELESLRQEVAQLRREKSACSIRLSTALRVLCERDAAFVMKARAARDFESALIGRIKSLKKELEQSRGRVRALELSATNSGSRMSAPRGSKAENRKCVIRGMGLRDFSRLENALRKELMGATRKGVGMARDILGQMTETSEGGKA